MKTRILLSVGLLSAFLLYNSFPKYYFAEAPVCVASFTELDAVAYEQAVLNNLADKKPSEFRYFFQTFIQEEGKDYILANMRNKTDCFDAKILIEKWDKLAGMKRTNGIGYPKELYNLKWKMEQRDGYNVIVYQDMRSIID